MRASFAWPLFLVFAFPASLLCQREKPPWQEYKSAADGFTLTVPTLPTPHDSPVLPGATAYVNTSTITILYNFDNASGCSPECDGDSQIGGLIATSGVSTAVVLYGTSESGGANGYGTLWKYVVGVGFQKLYDFGASTGDGRSPYDAPLRTIVGTDAALVGTASAGGTNSAGTIWEYDLNTSTYQTLYTMQYSRTEAVPEFGLIDGGGGLYYGVTDGGTTGAGGVYSMAYSSGSWAETDLITFSNASTTGNKGVSISLIGSDLLGLTFEGGTNNDGVVFQVNNYMP